MIGVDRDRLRGMAEAAAWLTGRRRRIRVVGDSMEPTLRAGEFVLVDRGRAPEVGRLVVARHPERAELLVIKRVAAIEPDGRIALASDNPDAGTDSRSWGPVDVALVEGTVTMVLGSPSKLL